MPFKRHERVAGVQGTDPVDLEPLARRADVPQPRPGEALSRSVCGRRSTASTLVAVGETGVRSIDMGMFFPGEPTGVQAPTGGWVVAVAVDAAGRSVSEGFDVAMNTATAATAGDATARARPARHGAADVAGQRAVAGRIDPGTQSSLSPITARAWATARLMRLRTTASEQRSRWAIST